MATKKIIIFVSLLILNVANAQNFTTVSYRPNVNVEREIYVYAVDATDLKTPETGLTLTCERLLPRESSFSSCAGTTTEIANGVYKHLIALTELDDNYGNAIYKFTNAAMNPVNISVNINPGQYQKNMVEFASRFDNAYWGKSGATVTANSTATHDGLTIGDTLTANAGNAGHWLERTVDMPVSGLNTYVASLEFKPGTATHLAFGVRDGNFTNKGVLINMSSINSPSLSITTHGALIQSLKSGWYRINFLYYSPSSFATYASHTIGVGVADSTLTPGYFSSSWTAAGTETVIIARAKITAAENVEPQILANILPYLQASSGNTVTLAGSEVDSNSVLNNRSICFQEPLVQRPIPHCRCITGYVGSTKVATLDSAILTTATNTQYKLGGTCNSTVYEVRSGGITSGSFATDSITASAIAANAVTSSELADNAITSTKIASGAITSTGIAANAIGASQIATDAITNAKIATDAIGSSEFAQAAADKVWSSSTRTLTSFGSLTLDVPNFTTALRNALADTTLRRSGVNIEGSSYGDTLGFGSLYGVIQQQTGRTNIVSGAMNTYKTDNTTILGTRAVTSSGTAAPITGVGN